MSSIHMVVGLGNPGLRYALTRHNIGFIILDLIWEEILKKSSSQLTTSPWTAEAHGLVSWIRWDDHLRLLGVKPQTFMNRSGDCVAQLVAYHKIQPETQLLVIHDELDLPFGHMKLVKSRGPAGHNGIKDIHAKLGHPHYARWRVGIGKPPENLPVVNWVLSPIAEAELEALKNQSQNFLEVIHRWTTSTWAETVQFVNSLKFPL